jgi:hypothetical protein
MISGMPSYEPMELWKGTIHTFRMTVASLPWDPSHCPWHYLKFKAVNYSFKIPPV